MYDRYILEFSSATLAKSFKEGVADYWLTINTTTRYGCADKLDRMFQGCCSSLLFGLLVEFSPATMLKDSVKQPETNKADGLIKY